MIHGRVVSVDDGESLAMLDAAQRRHRIRLEGIDAPELGRAHGRAARQHLTGLAARRDAVAHCVRAGMAWLCDRYANELPAERRRQHEAPRARAARA